MKARRKTARPTNAPHPVSAGDARLRLSPARFAREEDGVLYVFAIYVFILILMIGGIGVDLMRFERDRAKLQYTLDRAVLAAADLDQQLEPKDVVADYFEKARLSKYLDSVAVDQGLSYREVSANASAEIETQFMHMTGVDTLMAPASSTAEERIGGVEISLVLDVSGSMNSNNRLPNVKVAARDFVDQMVDNTEDGNLSISIIPYATQVAAPDFFFSQFNVSQEHSYSNCINFAAADYLSPEISTTQAFERTMHFDVWSDADGRDDDPMNLVPRPICEDDYRREMLIMQDDRNTLKNFISNLWADGNTSLDIGMKWGTALLDPTMNPVINAMIDESLVDSSFSARPHSYDSGDTLKVIVLMTDGQNTSQYYIDEDFREGTSNVWWNEEEEIYSIYHDGNARFYWPFQDKWEDHAYGNQEAITYCARYRRNGTCRRWETIPPEPGEAHAVDYPDLWAYTTLEWNVEEHYEPWMNDNDAWSEWYYGVRRYVGSSTKDSRTLDICDTAKDQGIIVFTIGFEAPSSGEAVLEDCASSIAHYFDVEGLEISDAFESIASSIRKLRLTQ